MKKFSFNRSARMVCDAVQTGVFPSAVFSVGRDGEIFRRDAFGINNLDPEPAAQEKTDIYTRFDTASITKILGPLLIFLRMEDTGHVKAENRIADYVDVPPDKQDITFFQLLTHTAGFQHCSIIKSAIHPCREKVLKAILDTPLGYTPGTETLYTCSAFILLGMLLEIIGGDTLDRLFKKWVTLPLRLEYSGYLPEGKNIAATEYSSVLGKCLTGVVHDENARFLSGVSGNAGIFSNIIDMEKVCAMLSSGGNGFLQRETVARAVKNYTPGMAQNRGMGFHIARSRIAPFAGTVFPADSYGHTGFTGTSFLIDPGSGLWAILLSNRVHPSRENDGILNFRNKWHDTVYGEFL